MSTFKCKMCGGTMETDENGGTEKCVYCGTKQTVPKLRNNHIIFLYGRANHFRRSGRFDKAMPIYQQILSENSDDPESYWSIVLCRYGINYELDLSTGDMVMTINRMQSVSVSDDDYYKTALAYADSDQRELYQAEAEAIESKRRGILAAAEVIAPFDVLICCREEDVKGRATQDKLIARSLYENLSNEYCNVYFAGITLVDKAVDEYQPYVYQALRSARVMIVLGTKIEYFNDVRVRNEWSCFLEMIENGANKWIIPFCGEMKKRDLPEELLPFPSYRTEKFGAMRDLINEVRQILTGQKVIVGQSSDVPDHLSDTDTDTLLENASDALAEGDFDSAAQYCEAVIAADPTNADAYFGGLLAECRARERRELANCPVPFSASNYYRSILKYGDGELIAELQEYIDAINERNLRNTFEQKYQQAYKLYSESKTNKASVQKARTMFQLLAGYKDSHEMIGKCSEKIIQIHKNNKYREALFCYEEAERFCQRAVEEISDSLMNKAIQNIIKASQLFVSINDSRSFDEIIYDCKLKNYEYTQKLYDIQEKNRNMVLQAQRKENLRNQIVYASVFCTLTAVVIILTILLFG